MLTTLRKNKHNLIFKFIFVVLIISFAAFFGSGGLRSRAKGLVIGGDDPAVVNGEIITNQRFMNSVEDQMQQYRQIFKDKIPKAFEDNIKRSAVQSLINRTLLTQELTRYGFQTSAAELTDFVKNIGGFSQEGVFDVDAYRGYLEDYAEKTGDSFEHDVMQDLALQKFLGLFETTLSPNPQELKRENTINETRFKFSVVTISESAPVEKEEKTDNQSTKNKNTPDLKILSIDEKANQLWDAWKVGKVKKDTLDKYGLTQRETPELNYIQLKSIFGGNADINNLKLITSLTKDKPFPPAVIKEGKNAYLVKLIEIKKPEDALTPEAQQALQEAYTKALAGSLQGAFLEALHTKAKIKLHGSLSEAK